MWHCEGQYGICLHDVQPYHAGELAIPGHALAAVETLISPPSFISAVALRLEQRAQHDRPHIPILDRHSRGRHFGGPRKQHGRLPMGAGGESGLPPFARAAKHFFGRHLRRRGSMRGWQPVLRQLKGRPGRLALHGWRSAVHWAVHGRHPSSRQEDCGNAPRSRCSRARL